MADDLLAEGVKHFLDAQYALTRFQAEVKAIATSVLKNNMTTLASSLKVKAPSPDKIFASYWPSEPDLTYDGLTAWVGAGVWFENPVSSTLFLGLSFAHDDKRRSIVNAAVGYETQTKRLYSVLKLALSKSANVLYNSADDKSVGFQKTITTNSSIDKELRYLLINSSNTGGITAAG